MSLIQEKEKFSHLDGYRGFLAILVTIQHIPGRTGDYRIFSDIGYYVGVNGFFVLSAFLLTYRLLVDFNKTKNENRAILLHVVKYFIRRFFRIYVVFVIYWTMIYTNPTKKFMQTGRKSTYANYTDGLVLGSVGANHMWTIPCEIRYYFIIPLISLLTFKSGRNWFALWLFTAICILFNELFNPLGFTQDDYKIAYGYKLICRLTVFLSGSLLAILYYHIKSIDKYQLAINKTLTQKIINVFIVALFISQFRFWSFDWNRSLTLYSDTFVAGLYQCLFIYVLLSFNGANVITNFYSTSFLTACGKYSFGIYLFHPYVTHYSQGRLNLKYDFEHVFVLIMLSFMVAAVWFHLLEDKLMKLANYLCKRAESLRLFRN